MNNGIPYINIKYNRVSNPIIVDGELPDPSSSTMGRTYMQPSQPSGQGNRYNEYITILKNGEYSWELIGQNIDLSMLENKMRIVEDDSSSVDAQTGKYYKLTGFDGITLNLPSIKADQRYIEGFIVWINITTTNQLSIVPATGDDILYCDGWNIEESGIYEINFLSNGSSWYVTATKFNTAV